LKYQIKSIPECEGYFADNFGDIYTSKVMWKNGLMWFNEGKPVKKLKKRIHAQGGYYRVRLCINGKGSSEQVHTLILKTFVGERPSKMQCCHYDGNPRNNRLDNLRWDTVSSNALDRVRHGTNANNILDLKRKGEKHPRSKLTENQVVFIKKNKGILTQVNLAHRFNVSRWCIRQIHYGHNWKHVLI